MNNYPIWILCLERKQYLVCVLSFFYLNFAAPNKLIGTPLIEEITGNTCRCWAVPSRCKWKKRSLFLILQRTCRSGNVWKHSQSNKWLLIVQCKKINTNFKEYRKNTVPYIFLWELYFQWPFLFLLQMLEPCIE